MASLRFGLLGTGYWAEHAHGAALVASPHAELHGVWGREPAKAHDLARRLGAQGYDNLDDLLGQVDAVAIAVPPDVQAYLAVKAAGAGCHLLLDKPLALDVPAAEAVVRAADGNDVASVMFFTARYRPEVEHWTEVAAEGGPWHSAHLVQYGNIFEPGNPFGASPWRREYGALWDVGPHALAAVVPVLGRVASVAAHRGPAGSDTVHLILSHMPGPTADGAAPAAPGPASTVSLSLSMPSAATGSQLTLYGEHGTSTRPEGAFEATEAFANAVAELAQLVQSGERRHRCDVHFGLDVTRVLAAAERALEVPAVEIHY